MKTLTKKITSVLMLAAFIVTGMSVSAAANVFNYLPKECNVIGNVNLKEIKTIKSVNDAINQTQDDPMYQCLKASGLTADNINNIVYGMNIKSTKDKNPSFIALLETDKKSDVKNFVKESTAKDKNVVITTSKENGKEVYKYENKADQINQPVYCTVINSNLIALGTQDYISACIKAEANKQDSALSNDQMMKLIGNEKRDDMVWVAAIVPPEFNKTQSQDSKLPKIDDGILSFNYKDKALILKGNINCATPQDVQKIMLPVQMFLGIFAMNKDSGINPQDISLIPNDDNLAINIKLPEKTINAFLKTQKASIKAKGMNKAPNSTLAPAAPSTGTAQTGE